MFNSTDPQRSDGFLGHVCCTVEYPNAWYFKDARKQNRIRFREWVVLFIKPDYLWAVGTRFCPRNAAGNCGQGAHEGIKAFESMFALSVVGARDKTYTRTAGHPAFLPTDEQAEVLIPDRVAREDLLGIGVSTKVQAKSVATSLKRWNVQFPCIWIVPGLFKEPWWLSQKLRSGFRLKAKVFRGG